MHATTLQVGRLPIAVAFVLSLLRVSSAYADQITLMWDPNSEQVNGYAVYVGSSQRVDVGNTTSYTLSSAVAGQQYCFAVAAYNAGGEGPRSAQACGYSNRFPTLTNPGNRSATAGQATSLQLSGSDPEGKPITYSATGMPPGLFIGSATGYISGTPTTAGTYSVAASVYDGVLNSPTQTFTWTVAAASTVDRTAPSVVIAYPTPAAASYASGARVVAGPSGVLVRVSPSSNANCLPRNALCDATDALPAGSLGTVLADQPVLDPNGFWWNRVQYDTGLNGWSSALPPYLLLATTKAFQVVGTTSLSLSGTASDNVGVSSVNWVNDRGGSGAAAGTTNWSVASVGLQTGNNVITLTARDAAGNVGTDIVTVTYRVPDTTVPVVTITSPTSASTYTTSTMTISGTASDNVGVTVVSWSTDRGSSGTAAGTTNWTAAGVALQSGANVVTVTALDAAGNQGKAMLTVTYTPPDTVAPSVSILGPTTAPSYSTTSSVVTLGGTSSDNMGVTAVTWANNRGGSGFSSGTTNWSVPSVALQGGSNVITMTAQDAAGNKGTAVLTIDRLPSLQCTYGTATYAAGAVMSITMKNGVVDTWLAARAAEGWVVVSRTKAKSMTTVTLRCG
jgi:Putative Ig domain/Fibronectin type III domain/Glucodextranase, domain B